MSLPFCVRGAIRPARLRNTCRAVAFVAVAALLVCAASIGIAGAQENDVEDEVLRTRALAALPKDAARRLFSHQDSAVPGSPAVIGEYWKGCFTGGLQRPA